MRVLMTADAVGGVWTYALELARALEPHDAEVHLVTMGPLPSAEQQREARAIPSVRLYSRDYRLEWMADPWEDVRDAGEWLLRLNEEIAPHVAHLNGYVHAALPWAVPVLVVGHSCVLSWWDAVKGGPAPMEWSRYRREVTRGIKAADCVVAPTEAMLRALRTHYGSTQRMRVIPNGRTRPEAPPAAEEPLIFSAGRVWDEAKNIAALQRVAGELPWPVSVAGDTRHPDGGETDCEGLRLLGKLTPAEVAHWLNRAAIYALPARYEPFGLSALEAAQAGCALVLGGIPSLREVWGDAAVFVDPEDPKALRDALQELIRDEPRRRELGERARRRAKAFTPEAMALDYLDLYRELLQARLNSQSDRSGAEAPFLAGNRQS